MTRLGSLLALAVLAIATTQVACGGADDDTAADPRPSDVPPERTETPPRRTDDMTMTLSFNDTELTATLDDNETTRDFLSLLPLELTLTDYRQTERISDLPRPLSTAGEGSHDAQVGDITYYVPWGSLAIFYREYDDSPDLIRLGHIDSDLEQLTAAGAEVDVTITRSTP